MVRVQERAEHGAALLPGPVGADGGPRLPTGIALVVLGWAALHAAATFLLRFTHPFQLEWSEGSTYLQAVRFLECGRIYTDPWESLFVAHLYPPLHTFVLAGALSVFPAGLAVGRVLSLAATLAAALLIAAAARRAGAGRGAALAAPLAFLGFAPAVDYWYDLVRVDMLFTALFAGAVLLSVRAAAGAGRRSLVGSALLLVLAALAKQSALAYGPALFLGLWACRGPRAALLWGAVAGAALAAALGVLQVWSGGWFWYFAFTVLGRHPGIEAPEKWGDMARSLLPLAPALLASLLAWPRAARSGRAQAGPRRLLVFLTLWGFPFAAYAFLKHGGFTNAWLPLLATALPAAAAARLRWIGPVGAALSALLLLQPQLALAAGHAPARLLYEPAQVPLAGDRAAQEAAVGELAALGGSVWCPEDVWVSYRATGEILPLLHLVGELMEGERLPGPLVERLEGGGFRALLFSESFLFPGATTLDWYAADPRYGRSLHARILRHYDLGRARRLAWPSAAEGYQRVGLLFRPALLVPLREEP